MKKLAVVSAAVYVIAWIIGLAFAASGPKPDASSARITSYFAGHEHTAMLGHLFVDGLAGLALIGIALLIGRFLADEPIARLGVYAGLAASGVSLGQFIVGVTFTYDAAHKGSPRTVRDLFVTLNDLDTVKIILLGAMIGAVGLAGRRSARLPRWFSTSSLVFAPLLAISGLAFPTNSSALLASLDVTLLLLLIWAATFATFAARSSGPEMAPEGAEIAST